MIAVAETFLLTALCAALGFASAPQSQPLEEGSQQSRRAAASPDAVNAPPNKLAFVQQPVSALAGAILSPPVTVQLTDNKGTALSQSGVPITLTLSSGTGVLNGTTVRTTDTTGLASFGDLSLTLTGTKKLTASNPDFQSANSNNFTISAGPPSRLALHTEPPSSATAGVPFTPQPVLWVLDAGGNQVTTDNSTVVTASRLAGTGTLQGTVTATAQSGTVAFANLSHNVATTITILFASGSLVSDTSSAVQIVPASAAQLLFLQQPTSTPAGAVITPPVTVAVEDAFGNLLTTSGTPVTVALSSGTGTLGGTLTRNSASGISTFDDLHIDMAGSKTLGASSGQLTAAKSGTFTILSRGAKALAFTQQPTGTLAGAPISPPVTVQVLDSLGNNVATAGVPVTLALASGSGTLAGTTTQSTDTSGKATFSGLSINLAGTKSLSASSPALATAISSTFTVTPGPGVALHFSQQPTPTAAGAPITPAVTVQIADAEGNSVAAAGVAVTISLSSGTGVLTGTIPQSTDASGLATFSNLSINATGIKKLTASGTGLAPAVSDSFLVSAGSAARLSFTTSPGGGTAGIPFPVQPVLTIEDVFGNAVTGVAQDVTVALQNDAGGGATLGGTKSLAVNTSTGQAVFAGLSLDKAASSYTLTATGSTVSTTPGSVVSAPFAITAATPSKLRVETAADGTGTVLAAQNVTSGTSITAYAIARDAFDNFTGAVAADQWSLVNITGGVLATDLAASADRKSATFTGRQIGSAVISATAAGLSSVPSGTLTVVVAGAPAVIRVETAANGTGTVVPAQTVTSGKSITVYAIGRDAAGNFVANIAADSWTLQNKTAGVSDGDLVPSTEGKSATFTGRLIGSGQIHASSGTLAAVNSGVLTVAAGSPAAIASTGGTPQSARIGTPFPARLTATVRDGAGNPARGVLVTWTPPSSGAGGSFGPGMETAATDSNGVAGSGVFTANTVAGSYTVAASAQGISAPALFALTNLPALPARITPSQGTPQGTTVNTAFPTALAASVKDSSGNGVSGAVVTFSAPSSPPGGTFSGGLSAVSVAASSGGIATAPPFVAGPLAGSYQVSATVEGVSLPALFDLTNTPGSAGSVVPIMGTPQSTQVGSPFLARLAVQLRDASGNPVAGATVLFSAPLTGASGSFAQGATDSPRTDISGTAIASILSANTIAGTFTVTATAPGVPTGATFLLTNTPGPVDTFLIDAAGGGAIGTQVAQVPFNIQIRADDQYGNSATQFTGTVDITSNGVLLQAGVTSAPFVEGLLSSHSVALQNAGRFIIQATRSGGAETGRTDTFQVVNPAPTINRLSPTAGTRGQTLSDTITGWGFIAGVTTVSFGDKITTSTTVNSLTQITVTLTIDTSAAEGPRDVLVINGAPGGGLATVSGGFVVGNNPLPTLTAVSPDTGGMLERLILNLNGNNFVSGMSRVNMGAGISVNSVAVKSSQLITADVSITGSAAGGTRRIAVTNDPPGGGTSDSVAFTVSAPSAPYPLLNAPADGAAGLDTVLTFSWHPWPAPGVAYRLQISGGPDFSSTVFDDTAITDTSRRVASLAAGSTRFWRVSAWNTVGSSAPSPARSFATVPSYPVTYTLLDTITFPAHTSKSDYQATDYRLIGIPGESRTSLGSILGGTSNVDWTAFWDNGASSNYLVSFDGSSSFLCTAGRAFWVLHKGPLVISRAVSTAALDSVRSVAIPLHSGWNLITSPFLTPVSWSTVQLVNGPGTLADPWAYHGSFETAAALVPYEGYLLDNADSRSSLRIPYARAAARSSAVGAGWRIAVTLTSGTTVDRSTAIGVSPDAKPGRDPLDLRMPRGVGTLPGVFLSRPGWDSTGGDFATDIRPPIVSMESWPMNVRAGTGQPARLTFDGAADVPERFRVMLIDDEQRRTLDLRSEPVYSFTPGVPVSRFRIVVGTEGSLQSVLDDVVPRHFALEKNFPNPFNPATTITVDVPHASVVWLKIYTILGQEVRTLHAGPIDAGRHFFIWDGTAAGGRPVSSGVYLVRLTNDAGGMFIGKMLLIR